MGLGRGEKDVPRPAEGIDRDLVAERAGGTEEGVLLAQEVGGERLQPRHHRVLPEPDTGRLGTRGDHGLDHCLGGPGDVIRAQVEPLGRHRPLVRHRATPYP